MGLATLSRQLSKIESATATKILRSATMSATLPAVKRMKMTIPRGSKAHRTYKKRLVGPGFARRSIRRTSRIKGGRAWVLIGVRREAFYAIQFYDRPSAITVTKRKKKAVKPYTIKPKQWLTGSFVAERQNMEDRFKKIMKKRIVKAIR